MSLREEVLDVPSLPTRVPPSCCRTARLREKPIVRIAADLGIAGSCLHCWLRQADVDEGPWDGKT